MATCLRCGSESPAENRFCGKCGNNLADPANAGTDDLSTAIDKRVRAYFEGKNPGVVAAMTANHAHATKSVTQWLGILLVVAGASIALLIYWGSSAQGSVVENANKAVQDAREKLNASSLDTQVTKEKLEALYDAMKNERLEFGAMNNRITKVEGRLGQLPGQLQVGSCRTLLEKSSEWKIDFDFDVKYAFVVPIGDFENIEFLPLIDPDKDIKRTPPKIDGTITSTVTYRIEKKKNSAGQPVDGPVHVRVVALGFGKLSTGKPWKFELTPN